MSFFQKLHCMHNLLIDALSTTPIIGFLRAFQAECRDKVLYSQDLITEFLVK